MKTFPNFNISNSCLPFVCFFRLGMPRQHPGQDMPNFYSLSPGGVGQITPPLGWWVTDRQNRERAQMIHVNKGQLLSRLFTSDARWRCAPGGGVAACSGSSRRRGGLPLALPAALLRLQPHGSSVCPAHVKHITAYVPLHNHMAA